MANIFDGIQRPLKVRHREYVINSLVLRHQPVDKHTCVCLYIIKKLLLCVSAVNMHVHVHVWVLEHPGIHCVMVLMLVC